MTITLEKRRMQGLEYRDLDVKGLDMSSCLAYGASFLECMFIECDFSLADLQATTMEGCTFLDCQFLLANFRGAKIRRTRFERCDMKQSMFVAVHPLDRVVFEECHLQYSSFFDSTVRAAAWLRCNLHGSDLRVMETNEANFQGSNLWNAQVRLGCTFFDSTFDTRNADMFIGMAARLHPDTGKKEALRELAGTAYNTVSRLMDRRDPA